MKVYMPVAPGREKFGLLVARQILKIFPDSQLVVIGNIRTCNSVFGVLGADARIMDEEAELLGLSLPIVRARLAPSHSARAGWFYQQCVKLQVAQLHPDEEDYLVWDADTFPLHPIPFYENEKRIFSDKDEYHPAYFVSMKRMLGLSRKLNTSYISEYMVINSGFAKALISDLAKAGKNEQWFLNVLDLIVAGGEENISFSEYETYGTYVDYHYPGSYAHKQFRILRALSKSFGNRLNYFDMHFLKQNYDIATFESHGHASALKIASAKVFSFLYFLMPAAMNWLFLERRRRLEVRNVKRMEKRRLAKK